MQPDTGMLAWAETALLSFAELSYIFKIISKLPCGLYALADTSHNFYLSKNSEEMQNEQRLE